VAGILVGLLLYRPALYEPVIPTAGTDPNTRRVHRYFSHELGPALYNGAQERRPFEMVVIDKSLNEALAQAAQSEQSGSIRLSSPTLAFAPGRVILMGTAEVEGAKLVITIEIRPQLLEDKRLNLVVKKVKIGAMNITPLAKFMAKKAYNERVEAGEIDTRDWRSGIAASLLVGEPFDPVFPVDDKWVRVTGFDVAQGKLTAQLVQVPAPKGRY